MNGLKQTSIIDDSRIKPFGKITQLIDLFVEMCFDNINSQARISQFKLIGLQLGFSNTDTEKVVEMGKSEYTKMLDELNAKFIEATLV